ncbi:MAG TPA: hypothetical protein VF390_00580 [Patescibacteria group bacterium]
MILTTHALVGAALGKNINNPLVIIPVSLVVHYALDSFRHGDYIDKNSKLKGNAWKVALDLFIGFFIILIYVYFSNSALPEIKNILIGSFFSMFPDLLTFLYWKTNLKILKTLYDFHKRVHKYFHPEEIKFSLKNALNDILVSLLAILFIFL